MENRYKIILSGRNLYKEIELPPDAQQVKVGTGIDCDVRLRKELFFGKIELLFAKHNNSWAVHCSDNLYLSLGDIRKLMTQNLTHGDSLEVKYQESDNFLFSIDFLIDFDDGKKKYERIIDLSGVSQFSIGSQSNANIVIGGDYVSNDLIVLSKNGNTFSVTINQTTYGVYINGKKAKTNDILSNGDFLSVSDHFSSCL